MTGPDPYNMQTARLGLRPVSMRDLDALYRLWIDPAVGEFFWDGEVIPEERAAAAVGEAIEGFDTLGYGLWLAEDGKALIGFCGLRPLDDAPGKVEVLYGVAPAYWGRGFATEMAAAMLRFGFEEVGLDRILGIADGKNTASCRVLEKAGMTFDGQAFHEGREEAHYSISREEFRPDAPTSRSVDAAESSKRSDEAGSRVEPPAGDGREVRARHEANRASWNETAKRDYARDLEESIAFLREGRSNLHPVERANLGNLRSWCGTVVHLQCSSGEDTLSLWNAGVGKVVGIDISDVHIANARLKSEALGAPAKWYRCDVLDAPRELDGSADLVYTGRGALCWLHDLDGWAAVVFRLLKPGGILHLFDDHPVTWLFQPNSETYEGSGIDYFSHAESNESLSPIYHERLWTLADVFGALRRSGFLVEHLGEHREGFYERFPNLRPELKGKVPLTFSVVARRP